MNTNKCFDFNGESGAEDLDAISAWVDAHWDEFLDDLSALVSIESVEDKASAGAGVGSPCNENLSHLGAGDCKSNDENVTNTSADTNKCAPWGAGPARALERALEIAERMGFKTRNLDGGIGYADVKGREKSEGDVCAGHSESDSVDTAKASSVTSVRDANASTGATVKRKQIALIGHVDVVPAGPEWNTDPFTLTKRDEYLLGRGIIDDKGPLLCGLYAVRYCAETMTDAPYDLRVIFGANEETGMGDLDIYHKYFNDPAFLFTPDAYWPLVYGEKGIWQAEIMSEKIGGGREEAHGSADETLENKTSSACDKVHNADATGHIIKLYGGTTSNAVPGSASARVRVRADFNVSALPDEAGVKITIDNAEANGENCSSDKASAGFAKTNKYEANDSHTERTLTIKAKGKSAHASTPEEGMSAINILAHYLLDNDLLAKSEIPFIELVARLSDEWDGSTAGLDCADDAFGKLTLVAGVISLEDGVLKQTIDVRFPTCMDAGTLESTLSKLATEAGCSLHVSNCMEPFLMDAKGAEIDALMSAYREVTGDPREPFTVGGGTYARHFKNAVSFGMEKTWVKDPDWVGGMHGPNEGVREDDLKEAMKVYIRAIQNLCKIEL